jgi:hypothetical protein
VHNMVQIQSCDHNGVYSPHFWLLNAIIDASTW